MASPIAADETQPLLAGKPTALPPLSSSSSSSSSSPSPTLAGDTLPFCDDPDNPRNWPVAFKWSIVGLLALLAFTVTFTCISVVPFASHIVEELEDSSENGDGGSSNARAASVLLVTIWELGEAAGPLAIAPLSETASWGRSAVLRAATAMFAVTTAAAALAPSVHLLIAARGLTGVAVATNVLNPAIVGDLFPPEQRGSAMALVQLTPLLGGAIGPAIGGAVADTWGWRSVLWLSTALVVACNVLVWVAFRETFAPAIQWRQKKRHFFQKTVSGSATPPTDEAAMPTVAPAATPLNSTPPTTTTTPSGFRHLRDAVLRPAVLLGNSLVLAIMAVYGAVMFSYYYIMSVTLPDILQTRYGLSSAATGSAFLAFSLGALVSVVACQAYLDPVYLYLAKKINNGHGHGHRHGRTAGRPEFKLPLGFVGTLLLPLATAAYGWAAELRLPLPLLFLAEALIGASMVLSSIPLAAYVVDAFGMYAASAMTGIIVTRCLCGTFLPLAVNLFGYGWGFTAMAGVCLSVGPIPFVVYRYGESWRQLSKYTCDA